MDKLSKKRLLALTTHTSGCLNVCKTLKDQLEAGEPPSKKASIETEKLRKSIKRLAGEVRYTIKRVYKRVIPNDLVAHVDVVNDLQIEAEDVLVALDEYLNSERTTTEVKLTRVDINDLSDLIDEDNDYDDPAQESSDEGDLSSTAVEATSNAYENGSLKQEEYSQQDPDNYIHDCIHCKSFQTRDLEHALEHCRTCQFMDRPQEYRYKFMCYRCTYHMHQISQMRSHVIGKHMGLKPHKCDLCKFATSIKSNLGKHVRSVHKIKYDYK